MPTEARNREWRQIARDRRDIEQSESQPEEPHLARINRETEDQRRDSATGNSEKGERVNLLPNIGGSRKKPKVDSVGDGWAKKASINAKTRIGAATTTLPEEDTMEAARRDKVPNP